MTKEDNKDFKNSIKCWICDNDYVYNSVKVSDHCHVTGKYRDSAQRDGNINLKLNHKIPVVFHNLKPNDDFKYLSQEFDNNVLDLAEQKGFYPYECMSNFEKV